jgi:hypothetical protein
VAGSDARIDKDLQMQLVQAAVAQTFDASLSYVHAAHIPIVYIRHITGTTIESLHKWPAEVGMTAVQVWASSAACIAEVSCL